MGRARRLRPSHSEVVEDAEGEQLRVLESEPEHPVAGKELFGTCVTSGASLTFGTVASFAIGGTSVSGASVTSPWKQAMA